MGPGVIGFEVVSSGLLPHHSDDSTNEGASMSAGRARGGGEEVPHGTGSQFQVVMKQLGKKDTTTKLKVLIGLFHFISKHPPLRRRS